MKKLNLIFVSLLYVFSLNAQAKSPPPGTGKADVPANIYIMLDTSGSMGAVANSLEAVSYPRDVAVDSNGNVYAVERYNHRVKKYDKDGKFIKSFGRYGTTDGRFHDPTKIDVDVKGNVYIRDNYKISKFDSNGTFLQTYGGNGGISPQNVAVDSVGNVFGTTRTDLYKWNNSGVLQGSVSCGVWCDGLSEYNGIVYATDSRASTRVVKKWSASSLSPIGSFPTFINNNPYEIEVTSKGIYVSRGIDGIQKYSLSGVYNKQWGSYGSGNYRWRAMWGLGSNSSGNILATDFHGHVIKMYDANGVYISNAGPPRITRMDEILKVIDKLTSSTDLTKGAYFGMQDWNSNATQRVKIGPNGFRTINLSVNEKITKNGILQTNPDYKGNSWYRPRGLTNLDAAMLEAQSYFTGSDSPINSSAQCQKSFLIVISDGYWSGSRAENIAKSLLATQGIQTLVIGFHQSGNKTNYFKLAKAGGTYPESPLFANNWQQLYETMSAYIRQAISSRLTFSAPVIMPNVASGDHIFQSTFTYKNNHQWEGQLAKFKLTSGGSGIGARQWEAGEKLNTKSESSRNIWTVANTFGVSTSINNFKTSNVGNLKRALWENSGTNATDIQASNLIKFVRGIDAYDENSNQNTTEERWKLGDIYNSRLSVIGIPDAKITTETSKSDTEAYYRDANGYAGFMVSSRCGGKCSLRKEVVYVGANDGMLHAFDSSTGEELWAFIPPMMLQSLKSMIAVKANRSNSIYGVDASPIVKDIFFNNQWRTVLMSGMGRGGLGYFALDVTNPLSPEFLFAFENKPSLSLIYHWDSSGNRTDLGYAANIPNEYDYSKIGETLSTPVIVAMPYGANNLRKWVAVFGGGYNAAVNTNYGSSIYVVDLEDDGKILKQLNLTDSSNNIANSMPADLVSITPDTTSKANYKGSMVYGVDLEGKAWKLNLTNNGTLYDHTPIFNAEATAENDRMEFFQLTPSIGVDNNLWNFYGTGNQQQLQRTSNDIDNRIIAIKDTNFPAYKDVNGLTITASSSLKNVSSVSAACPAASDLGWYSSLNPNERVTGKLALFNEVIYASRYIPNQGAICSPGTAYLSEQSMSCGGQSRITELGEGIATGAVIYNNVIYIGISGGGSGDVKDAQGNVIGKKTDNIIILNPENSGAIGDGQITQESWREIF